jgi:hypothetical protein
MIEQDKRKNELYKVHCKMPADGGFQVTIETKIRDRQGK